MLLVKRLTLKFKRTTQVVAYLLFPSLCKTNNFLFGVTICLTALSEKAASSQRAEYQFMSERSQAERRIEPSVAVLQTPVCTNLPQSILVNDAPTKSQYKATSLANTANVEEECIMCQEVIHKKITWARYALENEHDPNMVSSYMKVITSGVEAINVLRKFSP